MIRARRSSMLIIFLTASTITLTWVAGDLSADTFVVTRFGDPVGGECAGEAFEVQA